MIDELIYGMMPSAKIVNRLNAPPENISKKPRMVPLARAKSSAKATELSRDMSSYPIDYYKRKRKKNSPLQLGYTKDVAKTISAAHL